MMLQSGDQAGSEDWDKDSKAFWDKERKPVNSSGYSWNLYTLLLGGYWLAPTSTDPKVLVMVHRVIRCYDP